MLISTWSNCYVENKDIKFISQIPTDLKVPLLPSNCLESNCCMNRMSQEKILLTERVMKWPCQPMHQDFRVAGWVDQGEQLIISTVFQESKGTVGRIDHTL